MNRALCVYAAIVTGLLAVAVLAWWTERRIRVRWTVSLNVHQLEEAEE